MTDDLELAKARAIEWAKKHIEELPFLIATGNRGIKRWVTEIGRKQVIVPESPGIYLVYARDSLIPVYAGQSKNLRQRLDYHFMDNASSNRSSTLKKNLRRSGKWNEQSPVRELCRVRYFVVPFGRVEIEEKLQAVFEINTGRLR